jgi:heme/copper-type cytochrome/quinol oxidase subunit 2
MEPIHFVPRNILDPTAFLQAATPSYAPTSMTASVPSAAVQEVGGSNLLMYIIIVFIVVLALGVTTYLIVENGRKQRELQNQYTTGAAWP